MLTRAIILALMFCGTAQAGETVAFFGITFLDSSLQTAELGQDPGQWNDFIEHVYECVYVLRCRCHRHALPTHDLLDGA